MWGAEKQAKKQAVRAAEKQAVRAAEKQAALSSQVLPDDRDMDTDADENEVLPVQNSPSPPSRPSGRPNQRTRLPCRYCDELPPNPPIISVSEDLDENDEPIEPAGHAPCKLIPIPTSALFCTETNSFGVYRRYALGLPTITPDESFTLSSVSDSISIAHDPADSHSNASWWSSFGSSSLMAMETASVDHPIEDYYAPFLNPSAFLLMSWYYNGSSTKSYADVNKLIHNVIRHEDFKASDFGVTFSTAHEAKRMDNNQASKSSANSDNSETLPFKPEDGWIKDSVSILVPCDGVKFKSEKDAPQFVVDRIWYQQPLEVIKRAFSEPAAEKFHITPFREYWKPSEDEPEERIYSETFTADVFNEEYETLRTMTRECYDFPFLSLLPYISILIPFYFIRTVLPFHSHVTSPQGFPRFPYL